MKKTITHSWKDVTPTKRLKHKKCIRCLCETYFCPDFRCIVFIDRFGKIHFTRSSCVLPNTKL